MTILKSAGEKVGLRVSVPKTKMTEVIDKQEGGANIGQEQSKWQENYLKTWAASGVMKTKKLS